ncbi:MAG TPA: P-type DNA transfer ATPase VirB11 [Novosphingobium sp.]|nr:P-type DNA transfer ATPase VirB11 [Novosphingobium sp.]
MVRLPAAAATNVYLETYLEPFRRWLARETVTEILVNRPGEVWIEDSEHGRMLCMEEPEVDDLLLQRIAAQVARVSGQGINREHPLLAATLPDGARIQLCGPSATRGHWAMAIRRHRMLDMPLDAYRCDLGFADPRRSLGEPAEDPIGFLRDAVRRRQTILVAGGTSTGKTTFLNSLLREIPREDRVILIEDTPELQFVGPNSVGLVAVRGELGAARVTTDDLLQAALRLRPDRIVQGELRGTEALSFLRAINTGHPGSFSTIHASSPRGALEQIALMAMQAGIGLTRTETIEYTAAVVDIVVQLARLGGQRRIVAIERTANLLH